MASTLPISRDQAHPARTGCEFLPMAGRNRVSAARARFPAKRAPFGVLAPLPAPGFLPDSRPCVRSERGWGCAFAARTRRIIQVSNRFRPSHQCRKNSAGFLPEFCVFARAGRGWGCAIAVLGRNRFAVSCHVITPSDAPGRGAWCTGQRGQVLGWYNEPGQVNTVAFLFPCKYPPPQHTGIKRRSREVLGLQGIT
jgi:hypothetical protein